MVTEYDMRPAVVSRDADPTKEFAGVYLTDAGVKVPCVCKPSRLQAGKIRVEYGVYDVLTSGFAGVAPSKKHRLVWAMVDANRVERVT